MATQAQIKANRQNAQKSTGPKTAEGKAAVSQNAVKHGLLAESLIKSEDPAEYEAFHDNLLAELAPEGMVETLMAERLVSLWWRLRRAERMQNQAIDDMVEIKNTNPRAVKDRKNHYYDDRLPPGDPRFEPKHPTLGRTAKYSWSRTRVLDRLILYERRIENSLHKTLREFERRQSVRQQQAEQAQSAPLRDKAASLEDEKQNDLKKQSQFTLNLIGVTPFIKGAYDKNTFSGNHENKADQSQFRTPVSLENDEKTGKLSSTGTG